MNLRPIALDWFPVGRGDFPWTTLAVNSVGSLVLGILLTRIPAGTAHHALLVPGVIGGFGTLSRVVVEAAQMIETGSPATTGAYLVLTVVGGIVLVATGARAAGATP